MDELGRTWRRYRLSSANTRPRTSGTDPPCGVRCSEPVRDAPEVPRGVVYEAPEEEDSDGGVEAGEVIPIRRRTQGRSRSSSRLALVLFLLGVTLEGCRSAPRPSIATSSGTNTETRCFLLYEMGVGRVRRAPSEACGTRVTPASTFKIPHALAALDSGVLSGPADSFAYEGYPVMFDTWRRDHTLASAMRYSVVWYFQKVAEKLGPEREKNYLVKLDYGNADSSSGLYWFWLHGSLLISPDEQERFLVRLYEGSLPVSKQAQDVVRKILIQPTGVVVNATGEHPFAAPWPDGTTVSAKTGSSTSPDGRREVRWLVGDVQRADRSWIFVSTVAGGPLLAPSAAIDLAADALKHEHVL